MVADADAAFDRIAGDLAEREGAVRGQAFGMPCLKDGGKVFAGLFNRESMVFKLAPDHRAAAMRLKGARSWDPSGIGRPFKDWVEVPPAHARRWKTLAGQALADLRA